MEDGVEITTQLHRLRKSYQSFEAITNKIYMFDPFRHRKCSDPSCTYKIYRYDCPRRSRPRDTAF